MVLTAMPILSVNLNPQPLLRQEEIHSIPTKLSLWDNDLKA